MNQDVKLNLLEWKLLRHLAGELSENGAPTRSFSIDAKGRVFIFSLRDYPASVQGAARALVKRGLTNSPDQHGNHRLNARAMELAATLDKPTWAPPRPRPLNDAEMELLAWLAGPYQKGVRPDGWFTPLELGGYNGSFHSAALTLLVRHGYALCQKNLRVLDATSIIPEPRLTKRAKGSRRFQATDAGRAAVAAWRRQDCRVGADPAAVD